MRHYRVTRRDVQEAHAEALTLGGIDGVVSEDAILSAIGRPYSGYYRSITLKAAALTHSLVCNHGFTDGNKRTALLIVTLMIDRSGYELRLRRKKDLDAFILEIADGKRNFEQCAEWFKSRLVRRGGE